MDEGIGTLGLSPDVFWLLTWADLNRLLEAHVYNHNQHWDRTRYQSTMIANCAMGKKRTIKPSDLFKLPHDIDLQKKTPLPTKEEVDRIKNKAVQLPI